MPASKKKPRILVVTPEITYLPEGMGNLAQRMSAKAGGLADVSATLVQHLHEQGADVHVALPNYRRMFHLDVQQIFHSTHRKLSDSLDNQRIHLAEDRIFYRRERVYSAMKNHKIALAFQREVINNIIPAVQPDLIHCNDWMTGLIPAAAKTLGIPSLFTVHNIHSERILLAEMEDRGIDPLDFWQHLYFENSPGDYDWTRDHNPCNLLASGLFAADHVNSVSPTFLHEVVEGKHDFVPDPIRNEISSKFYSGNASGILNAPDPAYDPENDSHLDYHYTSKTHSKGKAASKMQLQSITGLNLNPDAPLFFWPSRLDPMQKGCQLLADILFQVVDQYYDQGLQVALIASGSFKHHFDDIVRMHNLYDRIAVVDFEEHLSHLGYAASDFMIMPSRFEPCGLPQMVAPKYGSIPVVHDTGGIHDTVQHFSPDKTSGNGFSFEHYSSEGLKWAIDEAMHFYKLDESVRHPVITRIMEEANAKFNHEVTAKEYIKKYEAILGQSLDCQTVSTPTAQCL